MVFMPYIITHNGCIESKHNNEVREKIYRYRDNKFVYIKLCRKKGKEYVENRGFIYLNK